MEIKRIERISKIQKELPPKTREEFIEKQRAVQTPSEDIIDISDEARELLRKLNEKK